MLNTFICYNYINYFNMKGMVLLSDTTICVLDETKVCDQCQDCMICSLNPNKKCDSCCACLEQNTKEYETIFIDEIILDEDDKVKFNGKETK